ncbi:NAD-dependent epimerase/dehydratase family protein [Geomonas oryzae]|uniref:NAD-dependent epimerase/dehydratase family protein n=1 Tax=Geomonas oryzae TaxID=2364273 RepID=UPI00100A704C|nr:NAD-dependent epimerase/dehydratase family protein [Geomonas oryzae]
MEKLLREMIAADCQEVVGSSPEALDKLRNRLLYVTGGTGFVGTWIAEMVCYLNQVHGFGTGLILLARDLDTFRKKAPHLVRCPEIRLVGSDVRDVIDLPSEVDYVIHAAATPDNRQHMTNPISVMDTITRGTATILDAAANLPHLAKILNVSSGQVYGRQSLAGTAITEDTVGEIPVNSITSVYPGAKRYAETLCSAYWSSRKLPIVTARPFAFMGPYQSLDKPWAINNFIRDALTDNAIRILSDGKAVRSYMYPSDMAYWLLRMLVDGGSGMAYNLGSPYGISLREVAEKVKEFSGMASEVLVRGMHEDNSVFVPDPGLVSASLKLEVKVDIDQTLKRSLRWFRETVKR